MNQHKTIDIHAHILPEETMRRLQKAAPSLALQLKSIDERSGILEIAGVTQKPFPREAWDLDLRLQDMDKSHVDIQLLSNTPQTFLYDQEASLGAAVRRDPERSDRLPRREIPGSIPGSGDAADAGAGARRTGASAGDGFPRTTGIPPGLQHPGTEPRRPGPGAGLGSRTGVERFRSRPSVQGGRGRAPQILLSEEPDRESARHDDRGGLSPLRRRHRALSGNQLLFLPRRRFCALPGGPLHPRMERAPRTQAVPRAEGPPNRSGGCTTTRSCTPMRRSSS